MKDHRQAVLDLLATLPDERSRSLALYGEWSDLTSVPCERCGAPLVLVEESFGATPAGIGLVRPAWRELIELRDPGRIIDATFGIHDLTRCQRKDAT